MTHLLRPGPIRGTQVLCEMPKALSRDHMVAELSARGFAQVDCPDCLFILKEMQKLSRQSFRPGP